MTPQEFCERFSAELPVRIHSRDTDSGGDLDLHPAFLSYVIDGEQGWQTERGTDLIDCPHPTVVNNAHCDVCDDTGYRPRFRRSYRRPIKRALRLVSQTWVPKDRPRLDVLLVSLAYNDGNVAATAQALRPSYSYMWSIPRAERFVDYALKELRRVYRDEEDSRPRSEAQQIAEAA